MSVLDVFKIKEFKDKIQSLETELARMQKLMTPEMQTANNLEKHILSLENNKTSIEQAINDLNVTNIKLTNVKLELDNSIAEKKQQVLVLDDFIELESFAFYIPKFSFTTAEEYKSALDSIRNKQKDLIKGNTAALGATSWEVNGSKSKGQKMVNDTKKLCLNAFNVECDSVISSAKFNNMEQCEKRIRSTCERISKLGSLMDISISAKYLSLKIDELHLAHEYAVKKQEEKEHLRELRAEERENARVQKELEDARRKAEKERKHYENALKEVRRLLEICQNDAEREILLSKAAAYITELEEIDKSIKDIDYREANQRAGYVYVISNIGAFGENIFKIGMTRRLDPQDRIDELGDASVPFNFDVHALIFSDDAPALETALHKAFDTKKLNMINTRREFFSVSLNEIKSVIRENHDKTVEFVETPPAEQYRETLLLKNAWCRISTSIENLISFADYFNISLDYLVGRSNESNTNSNPSCKSQKSKKSICHIIDLDCSILQETIDKFARLGWSKLLIKKPESDYFEDSGLKLEADSVDTHVPEGIKLSPPADEGQGVFLYRII